MKYFLHIEQTFAFLFCELNNRNSRPVGNDFCNILGGYLAGVLLLHISDCAYLYRIASSVTMNDVAGGFIKSLVFGLLVATVCCHQGYTTHMRRDSVGPEAVGNATTSAVVISCVLILVADYVLTSFLL